MHAMFGVDKIGRPFYVDKAGFVIIDKLFKVATFEAITSDVIKEYELLLKLRFMACSELYDRQIHNVFCVYDVGGFGMHQWNKRSIDFLRHALGIMTQYYPEILGKLYIVNAPFIFTGIWAIIKGWLDEKIRRKIQILGRNFLPQLTEYVDLDQIPTYLGGTNDATFLDNRGPWDEYELIDSVVPGETVGVRRKG